VGQRLADGQRNALGLELRRRADSLPAADDNLPPTHVGGCLSTRLEAVSKSRGRKEAASSSERWNRFYAAAAR
jgi:hypothetical protein